MDTSTKARPVPFPRGSVFHDLPAKRARGLCNSCELGCALRHNSRACLHPATPGHARRRRENLSCPLQSSDPFCEGPLTLESRPDILPDGRTTPVKDADGKLCKDLVVVSRGTRGDGRRRPWLWQ